jgi:hypothetical protein
VVDLDHHSKDNGQKLKVSQSLYTRCQKKVLLFTHNSEAVRQKVRNAPPITYKYVIAPYYLEAARHKVRNAPHVTYKQPGTKYVTPLMLFRSSQAQST